MSDETTEKKASSLELLQYGLLVGAAAFLSIFARPISLREFAQFGTSRRFLRSNLINEAIFRSPYHAEQRIRLPEHL